MDPDVTLEDTREAAKKWRAFSEDDLAGNDDEHDAAFDLIESFENLDRSLSAGGSLPSAWHRATCSPAPTPTPPASQGAVLTDSNPPCAGDHMTPRDTTCACGMGVDWHQPRLECFDEAEFYSPGPVVTLSLGSRTITIDAEGDRCYIRDGETEEFVRRPEEFRRRFPHGRLPVDGEGWTVEANGWFELYGDGGSYLDRLAYSLKEAFVDAESLLLATRCAPTA